jgi:hypothetical protein
MSRELLALLSAISIFLEEFATSRLPLQAALGAWRFHPICYEVGSGVASFVS